MSELAAWQACGLENVPVAEACAPGAATEPGDATREALRQEFIKGMRHAESAVTGVTTDDSGGRHGMAVSAFASVSADPPTVLACLRSSSRICSAVVNNRMFTVSALTEHDGDVARTFAAEFDSATADRFAGIRLEPFTGLAPGIAGAPSFACSAVRVLEQHTHTIVIGRVMRVAGERRPPLLYHNGGYGRFPRGASPHVPT